MTKVNGQPSLATYIKIFLGPTLLLKAAILFFGLNYSAYPGDGYGYGLAISIALSVVNLSYFIYRFKDYKEN